MNTLVVLRTVFVILLVATVLGKINVKPRVDMRSVVSSVLALQGYRSRFNPQTSENILASVEFEAPGCVRVVQIMLVSLQVWEEAWLREAIDPTASKRFVYLDRTWLTVDRFGMRREWLKHKALSFFGWSRYVVSPEALLVVEPPDCHVVDAIDWRMMWDKQMLSKLDPHAT